jgi:transcriptional regulator with XRE-family HTH domain
MKIAVNEILKKKGFTAYRLSKETGLSMQLVSQWVRKGTSGVRFDHLVILKEVLDLSWDELGQLIEKEAKARATRISSK